MTELYLDTGKNILGEAHVDEKRISALFDNDVELVYRPNEEMIIRLEGKAGSDTEYFYLREAVNQMTNFNTFSLFLESHSEEISWNIDKNSDFNGSRLGEIEKGIEANLPNQVDNSSDTDYIKVDSIENAVRLSNRARQNESSVLIINQNHVPSDIEDVDIQIIVQKEAEDTPQIFEPNKGQPQSQSENRESKDESADNGFEYVTPGDQRTEPTDDDNPGNDTKQNPPAPGENIESKQPGGSENRHAETTEEGVESTDKSNSMGGASKSDEAPNSESNHDDSQPKQTSNSEQEVDQADVSQEGDGKDSEDEIVEDSKNEVVDSSSGLRTTPGEPDIDGSGEKEEEPTSTGPLIPVDARLELYDGPTGKKDFDSEGEATDSSDKIHQMYQDDVSLHYQPNEGVVICYFNAQKNSPQQVLAVYEAPNRSGDKLLEGFKEAVQRWLIQDAGWTFVKNAGPKQVIFDQLTDIEKLEPDYSDEEIEAMFESSPVHLETPNVYNAIRLFQYFREITHDNASIAISSSGVTDPIDSTDIVIQPGFTEEDVEPIENSETRQKLAEVRIEEGLTKSKELLDKMTSELPDKIRSLQRQRALAEASNSPALEEENLVVIDSNANKQHRAESYFYSAVSSLVILAIGLGYFIMSGILEGALTELNTQVEVGFLFPSLVPNTVPTTTVTIPSWSLVGGVVLLNMAIISAYLYGRIRVVDYLKYLQLSLPLTTPPTDKVAEEGRSLGDTLAELQKEYEAAEELHDESQSFTELIESKVFDPVVGINFGLKKKTDFESQERNELLAGVSLGIAIGAILLFVLIVLFIILNNYMDTFLTISANMIVGIGLLIIIGVLYKTVQSVWRSLFSSNQKENAD